MPKPDWKPLVPPFKPTRTKLPPNGEPLDGQRDFWGGYIKEGRGGSLAADHEPSG